MSSLFHTADRFLKYGSIYIWIIINLCMTVGMTYTQGWASGLYYIVLFGGLGTFIIALFGYWLFPVLINQEGNKNAIIVRRLALILFLLIAGFISDLIFPRLLGLPEPKDIPVIAKTFLWLSFIILGMILLASTQLTKHYHQRQLLDLKLEADKAIAELSILKNQINPHFLFNTLNNIYGLSYMGSKKAPILISKLSEIMRYLIYDCDQNKVKLIKERDLIKTYLDMQTLQYEKELNVDFYEEGILNGLMFPPMIIINFIENCFKHGDLDTNENAWVKISMEFVDNELVLSTENTVRAKSEKDLSHPKGIGLINANKLLNIYYPDSHHLTINQEDGIFKLTLKVTL